MQVSQSMERRIKRYMKEIAEDANPNKVFLKMKLNPGATKCNVASLLLSFFVVNLNLTL